MDFLTLSKKIQNDLRHLETYIDELDKNMKIKQTGVHTQEQENMIDMRIDGIITTFTYTSNQIKDTIEQETEETQKLKLTSANKYVIDMRESHILSQNKHLSETLKKFQNVQYEYNQREKAKLKQTFLIACPDATEDQLKALENPDKADELLNSAIALGSASSKNILQEAKTRKDKIKNLVEKINQLIKLIQELDNLVKSSNVTTDQLVINIEDAAQNTEGAVRELHLAREYQERRNKLIRIFGSFGIVIIIFVSLWVVSWFK